MILKGCGPWVSWLRDVAGLSRLLSLPSLLDAAWWDRRIGDAEGQTGRQSDTLQVRRAIPVLTLRLACQWRYPSLIAISDRPPCYGVQCMRYLRLLNVASRFRRLQRLTSCQVALILG